MAMVRYECKDHAGHKFWTARYGRYAIRIDASRPGRLQVAHHPGEQLGPQKASPPTVMRLPLR
jgi:hypothetical protein